MTDDLRETKVANFHDVIADQRAAVFLLALDDEDVCRFKIAMQDAFVVRGFDAGACLPQQHQRALHGNSSFAAQQLIERLAIDVFHHQKEDAFFALAKVGDPDDIRMLN